MNAVKRCLALFAATVAIGACSGDPTADLAGKDLKIRATPGAVWLQNAKTQTVLIEAVDATGSPAPGNWTATATGVATVTADTAFEHTSAGHIGQGRQFIIGSTIEGNGSVTITGTAGTVVIPVRVAPAPLAMNAPVSKTHPNRAQDPITVTLSPGLRFTSGTAANVVQGTIKHNGAFQPVVVSMSPDSTVVTVSLAPGSDGKVQLSGIASIETPTLTSTAATNASVFVDSLFLGSILSNANPTVGVPITLTAGPGIKFGPNAVISTVGATTFNGPQWVVTSRAADSSSITAIPPTNVAGRVTVDTVLWDSLGTKVLKLNSFDSLTTPALADQGADNFFGVGGAAALGQLTAPTVTGDARAYFDKGTWKGPDNAGDGCASGSAASCGEVDVRITYPVAGNYQIDITWNSGADVDAELFDATFNTFIDGSFNGAGTDEQIIYTAGAGEQNILAVSMFAAPAPAAFRVVVTKIP